MLYNIVKIAHFFIISEMKVLPIFGVQLVSDLEPKTFLH